MRFFGILHTRNKENLAYLQKIVSNEGKYK